MHIRMEGKKLHGCVLLEESWRLVTSPLERHHFVVTPGCQTTTVEHTRILNLRSPGHVWGANLIVLCCSLISLAKNFVSACKTSNGNSTVERQHRFDSLLL